MCLVDATTVEEPGSKGTDWRVHLSLDLSRGIMADVSITNAHRGESLARFQGQTDTIDIADLGYPFASSLDPRLAADHPLVVRANWQNLAGQTEEGERFDAMAWLQAAFTIPTTTITETTVWLCTTLDRFPVRHIAKALPQEMADHARQRAGTRAKKQVRTLRDETLYAYGFMWLLTNLPAAQWTAAQVLDLYRLHWHVEVIFHRWKSLLSLAHLRAHNPRMVQTYLLAKLLLIVMYDAFSDTVICKVHDWFISSERPVSPWRLAALAYQNVRHVPTPPLTPSPPRSLTPSHAPPSLRPHRRPRPHHHPARPAHHRHHQRLPAGAARHALRRLPGQDRRRPPIHPPGHRQRRRRHRRRIPPPSLPLPSPLLPPSPPLFRVPDARKALGLLAAAWEGYPSRRMGVIGVTGTDGKTTISNLIHSILSAAGLAAGLLTTVNARIGAQTLDTGLHTTTPDALDLQRYLRLMAEAGSRWAVVETTSHGLSQWRVAGVDYDIAVVTNVTHEHLDEHGSYEGYLAAKGRLLELMAAAAPKPGIPKAAILNAGDRSFLPLSRYPVPRRVSYGLSEGDVQAHDLAMSPGGMSFTVKWHKQRQLPILTPLIGAFNVYNILAAVSVAFLLDLPDEAIRQGVAAMSGISGRMERIDRGQDFIAIVDFAHTPFALQAALQTARTLTQGRVIAVFGSAGLRDRQKRQMMGEVAGRLADLAIVTAEDPRTEDLDAIIAASVAACENAGGRALSERDRYRAMQLALEQARLGDVVIICGKGHEQSMCFGAIEYPWDDRIALTHALDVYLGKRTDPPPLVLPTMEREA